MSSWEDFGEIWWSKEVGILEDVKLGSGCGLWVVGVISGLVSAVEGWSVISEVW